MATDISAVNKVEITAIDTTGGAVRSATGNFKSFESYLGSFRTTLQGIGATLAIGYFEHLVSGTIEAQAKLVNLASIAGTTAAQMSALVPAARLSETSLDSVAAASAKFSKNLIDVGTGNGKAAEAFKALGFSAEDAARFLKDPAQGLLELGQHLNEFADDGNKTAAVMALLGKNGAELLPFLKQLGEQTELTARLTNENAAAAKALEDQFKLLGLAGDAFKNTVATAIIPPLSDMVGQFILARQNGQGFFASLVFAGVDSSEIVQSISNVNAKLHEIEALRAEAVKSQAAQTGIFALRWNETIDKDTASITKLTAQVKILQLIRDQAIFANLAGVYTGDQTDRAFGTAAAPRAKPSVPFTTSDTAGVDAFAGAMEQAQKAITDAQIALDDFSTTEAEKTSPAMKTLIDLMGSDAFAKFGTQQQQRITDAYLEADAIQHTTAALKQQAALQAQVDTLLGELFGKEMDFSKDFAANLEKLDDGFDKGAEGLKTWAEYQAAVNALVDQGFGKGYEKAQADIAKIDAGYQKFLETLQEGIDKQQFDLDLLGKAPEEIARATAEYQAQLNIRQKLDDLAGQFDVAVAGGEIDKAQQIADIMGDIEDHQKEIVGTAGDMAAAYSVAGDRVRDLQDSVRQIDSIGRDVFESLFDSSHSSLQKIHDDIQKLLIDFLYQLTLKPFIINIAASLTGLAPGAVGAALGGGGGNPLSLLFGNSGLFGGGPLASGAGFNFATGSIGQGLGLGTAATPAIEGLVDAGAEEAAVSGLGASSAALTGFGSALSAAIPVIGIVVAGLALFGSGLFGSKHGPKVGGSASDIPGTSFYPGETTAEGDTSTRTLLTGVNTSYATFLRQLGGAGTAQFGLGFDTDPQGTAGNRVSGAATVNGQQVFKQLDVGAGTDQAGLQTALTLEASRAVLAALKASDLPANIAKLFDAVDVTTATQEQINAVEALAATYGSLDDTLQQTLTTAFDGTQATTDKLIAVAAVVSQFGDSITGLGPQIEALDPANLLAFVDAMGGASQFASTFAYINDNFTTSANKAAQAQQLLTTDFAALNLKVPASHAGFLALLNSFDLTTEAGRSMYGSVSALAPLFIEVAGTADQAAAALKQFGQTGLDYFNQHFLTAGEQLAQRISNDQMTIGITGREMQSVLHTMGYDSIPTTTEGFRQFGFTLEKLHDAGVISDADFDRLIGLAPAVGDLNDATGQLGDTIKTVTDIITTSIGSLIGAGEDAASKLLASFQTLANTSTGDFGSKLGIQIGLIQDALVKSGAHQLSDGSFKLLGGSADQKAYVGELNATYKSLGDELARFTVLSAQYDAGRAEQLVQLQDEYAQQQQLFHGNATALGAAATLFQQRWDAIINGATAAASSLDDFIKSIQQIAAAPQGNAGQQAGIELALSDAHLTQLQVQYAAALPGSALATALAADIAKLQVYNTGLVGQIAHFAAYTALYGQDAANQLVNLEKQFEIWKQSVAGNAGALGIVTDIFNDKFKAIVDGIAAGADQIGKLKVDIAEYLKGLFVSEISPLTPRQQLDTARTSLDAEIALAQKNDPKALGDVTQYLDTFLKLDRDFNASNQQFTDDFNKYTVLLGGIAGTQPNGQPLPQDALTAIAAALPANSTLASSDDVKALILAINEALAALANANSEDAATQTRQLIQRLTALEEAVSAR